MQDGSAVFSACRRYRYLLWRQWREPIPGEGYAMFVGLNPSTADETTDDPTLRRCIGFARDWGFGGLFMTNLFAWRATDPRELPKHIGAVGVENDQYLARAAAGAGVIVAAWGSQATGRRRDAEVIRLLAGTGFGLSCLGRTRDGFPRHPLYLPKTAVREPFAPPL